MPQDETEIFLYAPPTRGDQRRFFSRNRPPAPAPRARFSLKESVRQNDGRLTAKRVANLLGPLAQIVDAAGIAGLDLTPGGIWFVLGDAEPPSPRAVPFTDALLTEGLPGWLEVQAPDAGGHPAPVRASGVAPLAALAYELIGGTAPGAGGCYQVLPECDEESNALLRRALEDSASEFADAGTFAAALAPALRRRPAKRRRKKRRRKGKIAGKHRPSVKTVVFALAALASIAVLAWWATRPGFAYRIARGTPLHPNADYEIGLNLWNGMGRTVIDQPQAVTRFQAAAAKGYAPAEAFLAVVYQDGFGGVQRDELQAAKWAKASLQAGLRQEALQGDAEAQLRLGLLYDKGIGVRKDPAEAAELYQEAADQGNASGQYSLGICYFNGSGVARNLAKAVLFYQKASDQGNAFAQNNLAFCYQIGSGVAQDQNKAVKLYQKAAAQGNAIALKNLGVCYSNGMGVEKDPAKAAELYQKSADKGNALAEFSLGVCYENGAGVEKNLSKAIELYKKAADQGNDSAENTLGYCYERGIGVEKDRDKAIVFYIRAADQGNEIAQGRLRNLLHETAK